MARIEPIYLDNHATTRVDPRVVAAMLPFFDRTYGNASSAGHVFGRDAARAVDEARALLAAAIHASPEEIVFTSGATEGNNLAVCGAARRYCRKGRHVITVTTEHSSVLEPLRRLEQEGYAVTRIPVVQAPDRQAGLVLAEQIADELRPDTILVSVALANHEIGAVQPVARIGQLCKERGVLLHSDATQAIGRLWVDVEELQVDLMSFSSHKVYGPKGVGALYVRRRRPAVWLTPTVFGGGQEMRLRAGTLNVPGIVGFGRAVAICLDELPVEQPRVRALRDRLFEGLRAHVPELLLNGPSLSPPDLRLAGNLNISFSGLEGEAVLARTDRVAASTGSACHSSCPEPSHVLQGLGLDPAVVRGGMRFGLGRFNTDRDMDEVVVLLAEIVTQLQREREC